MTRIKHPDNTLLEGIVSKDKLSDQVVSSIVVTQFENFVYGQPLPLEVSHINYDSSLQFALRIAGDDEDYKHTGSNVVLGEQLRVAYI